MSFVAAAITAATAITVAGGYTAYSQYQAGAAQNKYYKYMADQSRQEGEYAIKQGETQSTAVQEQAKLEGKQLSTSQAQFNATQRAALAAAGNTGVTAEDITSSTFTKEQLDQSLVRYNADLKSWGVNSQAKYNNWAAQNQAEQYLYAGRSAFATGKKQSFSTLLTTASQVASLVASMGSGGAGAGSAGGSGSLTSTAKLSSSPYYPG